MLENIHLTNDCYIYFLVLFLVFSSTAHVIQTKMSKLSKIPKSQLLFSQIRWSLKKTWIKQKISVAMTHNLTVQPLRKCCMCWFFCKLLNLLEYFLNVLVSTISWRFILCQNTLGLRIDWVMCSIGLCGRNVGELLTTLNVECNNTQIIWIQNK